jgi:hypothetical protein
MSSSAKDPFTSIDFKAGYDSIQAPLMGKAMFNKNAKFDFLNSLIWKHFIGVQ